MKELLPKISLRQAMREVKGFEWEGDYRAATRDTIKQVLERAALKDIESLLEFYRITDSNLWPQLRTTNAIERRFGESKGEPDLRAYLLITQAWNGYYSPCSAMKTMRRRLAPHSP